MEIERKFLVTSSDFKKATQGEIRIMQGYLSSAPERTVRVRIKGSQGFITVKGPGNASGTSRYEWEKEIPVTEARDLLKLCEPGLIDKTRYEISVGRHCFEVDEFYGENHGLIVAEIELSGENEAFERPSWLGQEVTGDAKYYNAMLLKKPYSQWEQKKDSLAYNK
jgi:Uncharacterized protein conserved in bacteria